MFSTPSNPNQDAEHLKLLSIFHMILAGLTALISSFFISYIVIGWLALQDPAMLGSGTDGPPPEMFGWMFMGMGSVAVLLGWTLAVSMFLAGRWLKRRERYTFCLVVAAASCLMMPLGTVLGIFTMIVLQRPTVKAMFQARLPVQRATHEYPV
jgi:hypothetical protein